MGLRVIALDVGEAKLTLCAQMGAELSLNVVDPMTEDNTVAQEVLAYTGNQPLYLYTSIPQHKTHNQ
jgi:hypothetical protein